MANIFGLSENKKKVMVSGLQPSGRMHVGNYFGAVRQFVELSKTHETFVFIADLHALNTVQNAAQMKQNILDVAIDYLALGLDPSKTTLFLQSQVPAHAELSWIFNTVTTMPYLMRAHAFKDAEAKNKEISVGIFDYPMLMAADILLYDADVVPVGNDQKQHIEITRDTAQKFNRTFGSEVFKMPEAAIVANVGTVPGTDGQKMSKSHKNTIEMFASDEDIRAAVMKIPTDSKGVTDPKDPETDKVFALHKLFATPDELATIRDQYTGGKIGYKESKELLATNISKFMAPLREKRRVIAANPKKVLKILAKGSAYANKVSQKKIALVKEAIGTNLN